MSLRGNLRDIFNSAKPAESRQLACALTFCGGFIDAYTYIYKGDTHYPLVKQGT